MKLSDQALLKNWLYIPLFSLTPRQINFIKRKFIFTPKSYNDEVVTPIYLYDTKQKPNYIGLPIREGLNVIRGIKGNNYDIIDQSVISLSKFYPTKYPDPNHIKAAPYQKQFIDNLYNSLVTKQTVLAIAPTGTGKTVSSLYVAGKLGYKTLIVVHLERLAQQWIDEAMLHLGLSSDRVGIIRQNKCDFENKDILVGISHSIANKQYPSNFYNYFGTVIFDEVHRVGSPLFSKTISKFPAKYKLALTATPKRKDGCEGIFFSYFGHGDVKALSQALPCKIKILDYNSGTTNRFKNHSLKINRLVDDQRRNQVIVDVIKTAYNDNRNILIVSERIEHLQNLLLLSKSQGVPANILGQFTRDYYTGNKITKIKNGELVHVKEKKKVTDAYLDWVKQYSKIIFATYTMITEGIDIPRLDFGIDATPRSSAIQLIGRIRRPLKDKKVPVWVTIQDSKDVMLSNYLKKRLIEYKSANTTIEAYNYG